MQGRPSRVNARKLIRDLADTYPDHPFDVVVSELTANALDAGATRIRLDWNDAKKVLVVTDNGDGMTEKEFEQYHDLAAETKMRGGGIGFAGVGAKISFNIAHQVDTETRRGAKSFASEWRWQDDALWYARTESKELTGDGTRVQVNFRVSRDLPRIDDSYIKEILHRHYLPLFSTEFLSGYAAAGTYSEELRFEVNGVTLEPQSAEELLGIRDAEKFPIRMGKQEIGMGVIGLAPAGPSMSNADQGVMLCTFSKVIKTDSLKLDIHVPEARLKGLVEIPGLIEFLTTSKSDLKGGAGIAPKRDKLLNPVREVVREYLRKHGVTMPERQRNQLTAKLERELNKIVNRLPELQNFSGLLRRRGNLQRTNHGTLLAEEGRADSQAALQNDKATQDPETPGDTRDSGASMRESEEGQQRARKQRSRRNQGPLITFEDHPNRAETGWVDGEVVVINSGHPAYAKQLTQDQARFTYCIFTIGNALQKAGLGAELDGESYVDKFVTAWGS